MTTDSHKGSILTLLLPCSVLDLPEIRKMQDYKCQRGVTVLFGRATVRSKWLSTYCLSLARLFITTEVEGEQRLCYKENHFSVIYVHRLSKFFLRWL